MALVKTLATPIPTPVGSGVYAPAHVGPVDYAMCWEARTVLPATVTRSLPGMVPSSPGLIGATSDMAVEVVDGQPQIVKTAGAQALRVTGQPVTSRTIMVVSRGWGNATRHFQIPGLVMGIASGNLNAYGTANVVLGPDDARLTVRVVALDTSGSGIVHGSIGATPVTSKPTTVGTATDIYLGANGTPTAPDREVFRAARVWNRALTPAEIATVVEKAAAAYGVGL